MDSKRFLEVLRPKFALKWIALAVLAGALLGLGGTWLLSRSEMKYASMRTRAQLNMFKLYELEMRYKPLHGGYAKDFDSLIAESSDGARIKAELAEDVDMNTFVVAPAGRDRFKIEANVQDPDRTPIRIRGPLAYKH